MSVSKTILKRREGERKEGRQLGKAVGSNTFGISDLGLNRLNTPQIYALYNLFHTNPAVHAARTVLHSQLFSGGVQLVRDGEMRRIVKESDESRMEQKTDKLDSRFVASTSSTRGEEGGVKQAFAEHLEKHWVKFAKDVCDSFLCWGICAVAFDVETEDPSEKAVNLVKQEEGILRNKSPLTNPQYSGKRIIPIVPQLGTYEIGFESVGKYQYRRQYNVYAKAPGRPLEVDEQAVVHVRTEPDSAGNVNSPLATIFEMGSFVQGLTELAMTAEIARATPQIVTQLRKQEKGNGLDPGSLFFDQESRNVQSGQDNEESQSAARALEMQASLCRIINTMQTTHRDMNLSGASAGSSSTFQGPDIPPKLFTLPKVCTT